MKKTISLLLIAALTLSLCACSALSSFFSQTFGTPPETTNAAVTQAPQTEAPTEAPTAPSTEAPTAPTVTDAPPFVAPALSDCVGLYSECSVDYSDGFNDCYATYQLPEILLDSTDARRANDLIRSSFEPHIDESLQAQYSKASLICTGISYDCWIYDKYLSVLIHESNDWGCDSYMVFTFDLTDGSWLGNEEYAAYLGLDQTALNERIRESLLYHFDTQYAELPAEYKDAFFDMQREKQDSDEAVRYTDLYLDRDGSVQMVCMLYSIAGADGYFHTLPLLTN